MAHEILKPEKWASAALGLLERDIVLAGLISRDSGADFTGAKDDTVNIKRPSMLAGTVEALRAMDTTVDYRIVSESLNERKIQVTLTDHVYSAIDLSDAELSLDVTNFGVQVLSPQVKSIVNRVEFMVGRKLNGVTADAVTGTDIGIARRTATALRKKMNKSDVPASGRILVVGVDVEEIFLNDPHFTRVDQSGTPSALRDAEIGRVAGFRVVVSNTLTANRMVALHPSAYTLVTRAPLVPEGAVSGKSESHAGVAIRALKDYNSAVAKDRSFLSTFTGIGETLDPAITYAADGKPTLGDDVMLRAVAATVTLEEIPSP